MLTNEGFIKNESPLFEGMCPEKVEGLGVRSLKTCLGSKS